MRPLTPEPLTPQAFEPFGQVISALAGDGVGTSANQGTATRIDRVAAVENRRPGATANLAVFKASPQPLPLQLRLLERHPHSTQAFLPLRGGRLLVCVAPERPDGLPDLAGLRAFVAEPGQGVSYRVGTWHHPIVALDAPAELAMLAFEDGTAADCEEWWLPEPHCVHPAPG